MRQKEAVEQKAAIGNDLEALDTLAKKEYQRWYGEDFGANRDVAEVDGKMQSFFLINTQLQVMLDDFL